jgi:hypothetical protein
MNYQWLNQASACPIVEFHDVRTERFKSDAYLSLHESRLTAPLVAAGGVDLGQFMVRGHPDRVVQLRGFAGMLARRRALTAFHAGDDWASERRAVTYLVRDSKVMLTRSIVPGDGVRAIRSGEPLVALISEVRFAEQIGNYHLWLRLLLRKAGMDPVAAFATLEAVNDVPAVPVVRNRSHHIALMRAGDRMPELPQELRGMLRFVPEVLTLEPTHALVW